MQEHVLKLKLNRMKLNTMHLDTAEQIQHKYMDLTALLSFGTLTIAFEHAFIYHKFYEMG